MNKRNTYILYFLYFKNLTENYYPLSILRESRKSSFEEN